MRVAVTAPGPDDLAGDGASRLGGRRVGAGVHAVLRASDISGWKRPGDGWSAFWRQGNAVASLVPVTS